MSIFDIYVHGTPRGHQIWGSEHSHDYISTFYNHDTQASEKVILQIDVCGGDSFYTYIRRQNVSDVEGRPHAFFALTVGFRKAFCTNVYRLYQLFDAVYNQICVGSILKQSGSKESYLVADLTTARSGVNATVDKIQAVFTKKIAELIVPTLQSLSSGDTFNRSKKTISHLEVDSPLFFEYLKKYSVIVSPNMQPSAIAYDTVAAELKQVSAQKKALSSSNEQLQADLATLSQENKSLSAQLHASASSIEKKYKSKLEQLQNDLASVANERDSLKQKIQDATSSIELMDQPFQKLTRLLARRFPEKSSTRRNEPMGEQPETNKKYQKQAWSNWINSLLLGIILVICCVILALVLKSSSVKNTTDINPKSDESEIEAYSGTTPGQDITSEEFSVETEDTAPSYDSWNECILNIRGGGDNLEINKEYTLSVTKKGALANIPTGYWSVYINSGEEINKDNTFIITDPSSHGKNIMIEYIVNGESVKRRVCKIQ